MDLAAAALLVQVDEGQDTGVHKIGRTMTRQTRLGHPISRCSYPIGVQGGQLDLPLIELTV